MTIVIGEGQPSKDIPAKDTGTRNSAKTEWKEDVHELLTTATDILKNEADEDTKAIVEHLDMALKALAFDPKQVQPEDDTDIESIMGAKKKADKKASLDMMDEE